MKKRARYVLWAIFFVYCAALMYLVFFSRGFRTQYSYSHYFKYFTNFIPFKTITHYIDMYNSGFRFLPIWNLLGNFVLFLPMGLLLPCVFKGFRRFRRVVLCIFIMVVLVEVAQFSLRVGIIDVDDVIFNLSGAMIGYGIFKIPPINKILHKIYFIDDCEEKTE